MREENGEPVKRMVKLKTNEKKSRARHMLTYTSGANYAYRIRGIGKILGSLSAGHLPAHPLAQHHITMASTAQKHICPCSSCNSEKLLTRKTIKKHLGFNDIQLQDLKARGGAQQIIHYLQDCKDQTERLLASLGGGSQGSTPSPHPDGVYFFYSFNLAFNHN
jgi:hypothetical protein